MNHTIICVHCKSKYPNISDEQLKKINYEFVCECLKQKEHPDETLHHCGAYKHPPVWRPKGISGIYNCEMCTNENNSLKDIKVVMPYGDPVKELKKSLKDNYVAMPHAKSETQLLLEEQKATNSLLRELLSRQTPETEPHEMELK